MGELDRRALFGLAGAAAFARGAREPADAGAAPPHPYRKALKWGMVHDGDTVREKFELLAELGFDGVELDSPNELDPDEVLAARDATGVAIPGVVDSVHWQHTLGDPDETVRARGRAALETALRDCALYGGTSVLLVPAVVSRTIRYDQAWERSQAEIRRVLPLAAELGVHIALENVWNQFLLSPLEAARYVDAFESRWVGWHLDVGNLVTYGWPEQWVRILGPRVLKLDVKGYSLAKRDGEGLWRGFDAPIGEGDADWSAVNAALRETGYLERGEAWAAAEVGGGDRDHLADVARRMDDVLAR